ncbi:MAG: anthranilate phosphoribosyltransferase [Patescibacteria group bacterium]
MKTLIIDNFDSFTYNLFQYIAELGGNPEVRRNNEVTLGEIERGGYTHVIISPGPGSPDNKKDFGVCGEVITQCSKKIPVLGVCLGHQGIVHYLGGRVVRAPKPMHGKRSTVRLKNSHQLFQGLPETIEAMRYHSLTGERKTLPRELDVIAESTDDGLIMGITHKTLPLYGVQFHPESIGTPMGKQILKNFLGMMSDGRQNKASNFINGIVDETISDKEMSDTLKTIAERGESADEIAGMADALRAHALAIPTTEETMDTCGTGGSGFPRMNISTTVAFVLAAGGVKIAKHGNKAASGRCGSFDLLESLGVNIQLGPDAVTTAIKELGIGFIFAPLFHPAMKRIAAIRKQLGIRTIFNVLGPLVNPAKPAYHLLGTTDRATAEKMITAMQKLHYKRAIVVTGEDGLDEVTLGGKTTCYELVDGDIRQFEFAPEDVGIERVGNFAEISGGDVTKNAELFVKLLQGMAPAPLNNLLVLNSGFGFYIRGITSTIKDGVSLARKIIESGKGHEKFLAYKEFSHRPSRRGEAKPITHRMAHHYV